MGSIFLNYLVVIFFKLRVMVVFIESFFHALIK